MPRGRSLSSRVVKLSTVSTLAEPAAAAAARSPEAPAEVAHSPLYGVAMLKIAMELKKADARPLEELVTGVLTRMRLDEDEFRAFLELNGGLLRTIAQRRRY
jgi:hypothetical protein